MGVASGVGAVSGRLLPWVRAAAGVLLALAIANGVFLYLLPGRAATDYAWAIKPAASAAFMGAGYLAGAVATGLVTFRARRWRSAQPLVPALFVLSVLLLAATLIHRHKFRWEYPLTWVWTAVYAAAPFAIVMAMVQQRAITDVPEPDPSLRPLRVASLVVGALLAVFAASFFVAPARLGSHWPWPLTPLMARVVASWAGLIATSLLWSAADLRRPHEAFIPYAALATWGVLLLAIPALHHDEMTRTGTPLVIYLTALAAVLALAAYGISRSDRHAL